MLAPPVAVPVAVSWGHSLKATGEPSFGPMTHAKHDTPDDSPPVGGWADAAHPDVNVRWEDLAAVKAGLRHPSTGGRAPRVKRKKLKRVVAR